MLSRERVIAGGRPGRTAGLDRWSWPAVTGACLLGVLAVAGQSAAARRRRQLVARLDESARALRAGAAREQVLVARLGESAQALRTAAAGEQALVARLGESAQALRTAAAGEQVLVARLDESALALRAGVAREQVLALRSTALAAEAASRDPLTELGNRSLLRDRLAAALARSRRTGRPVGMLLLGLDGFQRVNEVHGHDVGDDLLRVVAQRLRAAVRAEDTLARLGGDEFVVIAEDLRTAQDLLAIAERIVEELDRGFPIGGRRVRAPASVGIALSHPDVERPDDLLREAGAAMRSAKRRGGGRYQLHGASASLG